MNKKHNGLSVLGLTLLALGTVVGGSFYLGSAIPIKESGPSVIIAYILGGALVYLILFALSEMTVANPTPGSFRTYAEDAFGPYMGFVVGWVYWTGLVLAMSSEATAVSIFLRSWFPEISLPVLGAIIIIGVILANLLGTEMLSRLESGLAAIKLFAIFGFILVGLALILGFLPNGAPVGFGELANEDLLPNGIGGIAGSMLIVIFTYAGFEIIGLAATETKNPDRDVPRAILYTVLTLVGLYTLSISILLPLIPTENLTEEVSPFVSALQAHNIEWAAKVINIILVIAILSTMLAATFGLGRMLRSLADEGSAPEFMKDRNDIPYRGIIFSGVAMLFAFFLSFILPAEIYIFLVSSGGFALLFTYFIIVLTHYRFRKKHGCPPNGRCQLPGFPFTSWVSGVALLIIISSMPLIKGQGSGLIAGLCLVVFYSIMYRLKIINKNTNI
ncbi:amino acid permease [Haloplasma contractile]|uniref:D-alanyl-D-alanine carboxypeptidase penicillin-binding protein 5-6 n=1 Tax=Haloplasma contractile SSD-17B TaxID=1033810 RepID=F7PWH6_9MOLU|nr:amino acid permease [Haloplasma contractile]ERJ10986.1 D-alanyl-D-alanine carboxypeptidase penicillin-binding protein 5-6 [Haloplasma contractile SSD-17B]